MPGAQSAGELALAVRHRKGESWGHAFSQQTQALYAAAPRPTSSYNIVNCSATMYVVMPAGCDWLAALKRCYLNMRIGGPGELGAASLQHDDVISPHCD